MKAAATGPIQEKSLSEKAVVLAVVVIPFFATLYAIILLWQRYVNGLDLTLLAVFYVLSGLGVTIGYHRLLTHRSFETYPAVRALLLILGSLALEGKPGDWASAHLEHHAHADADEDPHSPMVSLFHAHLGWLFIHVPCREVYGTWLRKDGLVDWLDRTWHLWALFGLAIPFAIGGWSGLLWGSLVRIFLTHHVTWSVNSICHTFGSRPYPTRDNSRNHWLVGLLAFGEGWHNNHHAFPRSAFHGLQWWEIDCSAYFIRLLAFTGLAWNVHRPNAEAKQRLAAKQPG
jgi:stearoyl-CoA desaturase (delta-9 desaturase)